MTSFRRDTFVIAKFIRQRPSFRLGDYCFPRPRVSSGRRIHYELFKRTYDRALANISLNPSLSAKISPNNCGLADFDDMQTVFIPDSDNSGYLSIQGVKSGEQVHISVRNAARVLTPIVESAISRGLKVIAKVACAGRSSRSLRVLRQRAFSKKYPHSWSMARGRG